MSDSTAGRAAQKARTRARIRTVAQELFAAQGFDAVPITEIAAAAEVSVQTVFNHFTSKEELFFADRATWVEGPAEAVRTCPPGVAPTTALRRFLVAAVADYVRGLAEPQTRRMIEVLEGTPALLTYERSLHEEAVALLATELSRVWRLGERPTQGAAPVLLAEVAASVWMAGVRSIVLNMRSTQDSPGDEKSIRAAGALTDRVLVGMERTLSACPTAQALIARAS